MGRIGAASTRLIAYGKGREPHRAKFRYGPKTRASSAGRAQDSRAWTSILPKSSRHQTTAREKTFFFFLFFFFFFREGGARRRDDAARTRVG